ncbi:MFS family permease [Amycolatopsis bartoniae]|uniref:MFS transporter n=1 Tax=Amycolatopsis bartoniae TaxID=941986 RepID=A0A8H9M5V6_9PSEU|nr:MFS transporter [Amycolatopsis bartoniae]MBB2933476.1 MFS family permease [Amycolatopsis bartoniae]TVT00392.1 MFS transporter [Amycolatopsis bartoniae]GHF59742.1 MFS transporter [Amycolatopsis bartoniae]
MTLSSENPAYRSAVRKFFRRMLPLVVFMLVINQMDRTNVGFVQTHLKTDLGIGAAAFGLGAGLFFVGYAIFEVPSNMLLERFGARVWLTRIMITWGVVVAATAFTNNATTFYILRLLLGVTEAGFFPGVIYYFTKWLPNAERGRATAIFLGGSASAYIVTGPISGALLEMHGVGGIAGWKWMFLLEGGASVVIGIVAGFFLVSRVRDAKWLTDEEKSALSAAVERDEAVRDDKKTAHVPRWKLVANPQVLLLCWLFFAMSLTGYAITFWLPSIVKKIPGTSDFTVGLLSAIPWICAIIAMYTLAWYTDRTGRRRPWVAVGLVLGAVGTFLATVGPPWFALVALCLGATGFKCAASAFWPLAQHSLDLKIAAAGIALINSLGNLGGFVGPTLVGAVEQSTGSTAGGLYVLSIVSVLAAGTVFLVRARYMPARSRITSPVVQ